MKEAEIHLGGQWVAHGPAWARGYAFAGNRLLNAGDLAALFAGLAPADVEATAPLLNGFFAAVRRAGGGVVAVSDRTRTYPLFYADREGGCVVSDDARWLAGRIGDASRDEISEAEFLLAGYVTGPRTLYRRVLQLQAAEVLTGEAAGPAGVEWRGRRYYRFVHLGDLPGSQDELLAQWDSVLQRAFARFLESIGARPIVLALSGGFDSRLVALMLKRAGRENVTCYSYGLPGNRESEASREVAGRLGFRWEFVPYSLESWRGWFASEPRRAFADYVQGAAALPVYQEWPAVWELRRRRAISDDSVITTGYTGDFIAGAHVPLALVARGQRRIGREALMDVIWRKHLGLWSLGNLYRLRAWSLPARTLRIALRSRVAEALGGLPCERPEDAAHALECWDWQERQSKFIVNAVRAFEFWGHDWRLPLWDAELLDFWQRVPLAFRLRKSLYNAYVVREQERIAGLSVPSANPPHRGFSGQVAAALTRLGLDRLLREGVRMARRPFYRKEYLNHPLGWYGIMTLDQFRRLYDGRQNINSYLVLEQLGLMKMPPSSRG